MKRIVAFLMVFSFLFSISHAESQLLLNPFMPDGTLDSKDLNSQDLKFNKTETGTTVLSSSTTIMSSNINSYILDPEILKEYRIGPGDRLDVHIIVGDASLTADHSFVVSTSGSIFFPNFGEINLSNLKLDEAKAKLKEIIGHSCSESFSLSLILAQPRQIKIYLTGQVKNQGPLVTWNMCRISEVIKQAGGVLPGGSSRTVYIKRGGQVLEADLYAAMGRGEISKDLRVKNGDIIEVPVSGSARVTIMGEVPRPGQYELKNGERLKDALLMAGYLGVNSVLTDVIYLKREVGKDKFEEYKLNLHDMISRNDESSNFVLVDGDIISIPAIEAYVYIYGEINRGGRIDWIPGKKLSDYINYSGGPTAKALLSSITVTRQERDKPKIYRINASDILYSGKSGNDIELKAGDVVNVPGNFFYFSDFSSFATMVFTGVALYNTFIRK